jgi:nicotinate-nucleotide adenylyltransferase
LRTAIFGGTFDPIHNGHLTIARAAADRFGLDRVLFIPAAHPPHKSGSTHARYEDRLRMIELAIAGDPRFEASRIEEHTERSYSIDTIEKLRAMSEPGDELYFLIGADAFSDIQTWHRWRDVSRKVRFLVADRPGAVYEPPPEVDSELIDRLKIPISSSDIRRKLAAGERPEGLPDEVLRYAKQHRLYR